MTPLLTSETCALLDTARRTAPGSVECSLDLQRSTTRVDVFADHWRWQGSTFPYPERCKEHTIYHWDEPQFQAVARYGTALVKLVPTRWGPPTFEIDGVKMLPSERVSPYEDARRKVALIEPRGKVVLDCCGGLGYFAACCLEEAATRVWSFEKNADVIWLRSLNPWSPKSDAALTLSHADIFQAIIEMPSRCMDAVLHDPPRFALAGELYAQAFYDQLSRVLKKNGRMFHYTGAPNKLSRGRDLAGEILKRLQSTGFRTQRQLDGVLAVNTGKPYSRGT